jgi:hypothetical protein
MANTESFSEVSTSPTLYLFKAEELNVEIETGKLTPPAS